MYLWILLAACGGTDDNTCDVDADCSTGTVCEMRGTQSTCVSTSEAAIRIGESAPMTGTNQGMGLAVKLGVEAAFAEQNAAGGIRGRQLQLEFRDDDDDPTTAASMARELTDAQVSTSAPPACPSTASPPGGLAPISTTAITRGPNAVLAMIGNVGSPTMVSSAPIAVETGTIYFGAFTGATTLLRDQQAGTCARYIFNVRASYAQEARATLELFQTKAITAATNILSFDQNDSFGDAGYNGLVAGYEDLYGTTPTITRYRYARNDDTSVPAQAVAMETYLAQLLQTQSGTVGVGIFMTDTYGAASELVKHVRDWQYANDTQGRLRIYFSNVSFVNADALSDRLVALGTATSSTGPHPYTEDVYVSQIVPNVDEDVSDIVGSFKQHVSQQTSFALEGYLTAKVLIAGLLAHQGPFTPETVAATLEAQASLPVGLPGMYGFSAENHQYSNTVWGTTLQPDGTYANLYSWRQGQGITLAY